VKAESAFKDPIGAGPVGFEVEYVFGADHEVQPDEE
jgi:hypothetical protein